MTTLCAFEGRIAKVPGKDIIREVHRLIVASNKVPTVPRLIRTCMQLELDINSESLTQLIT